MVIAFQDKTTFHQDFYVKNLEINKADIIIPTVIDADNHTLNLCDFFLAKYSMISAKTEVAIPTKK